MVEYSSCPRTARPQSFLIDTDSQSLHTTPLPASVSEARRSRTRLSELLNERPSTSKLLMGVPVTPIVHRRPAAAATQADSHALFQNRSRALFGVAADGSVGLRPDWHDNRPDLGAAGSLVRRREDPSTLPPEVWELAGIQSVSFGAGGHFESRSDAPADAVGGGGGGHDNPAASFHEFESKW